MFRIAFLFSVLWGLAGQAVADGHVKRIISTGETALGNKIVYPTGEAKITAFEFTVPVGAPVAPHTHPFPDRENIPPPSAPLQPPDVS